ncbi:hypothetical protein CYMTET_31504 [Cymbomonas tetramitiformis]|uniref:AIG1-type G domain-containing protein n=1 Tax=Cymbomonas tetramitiformis TaxID=36881 RepID=A0AAE0KST6_9CHLO|nr:hypothetical protein CYMTET_31504 [Cymbomonas tetramitiformis]
MESKKPLSLLLVGKIGTGKSSTGNSIIQRSSFVSKRSCKGVTVAGQLETSNLDGRSISVIDTPGMCDGTLPLDDLRNAFRVSLQLSPSGVSAIILVLSVNTRISDEEIQLFQELGTIFGRDWARWLVVVWTHVDQLTDDGTTLEEFLEGSPRQLLQLMTAAGGRSVAFDNRAADSSVKLKQISLLLAEADKVLRNNDDEPYTSEMFDAATLAANPPLKRNPA